MLGYFLTKRNIQILRAAACLSVFLGVYAACESPVVVMFRQVSDNQVNRGEHWKRDLSKIRKIVPYAPKGSDEYIVLPEYCMALFMDRTHVTYSWIMTQKPDVAARIIAGARYLFLPKGSFRTQPEFQAVHERPLISHNLLLETPMFLIYEKK